MTSAVKAGPAPVAPATSTGVYNYERFRMAHVREEVGRLLARPAVPPGQPVPDFDLPRTGGGSVRLRDLRGRPVLLLFGSPT